MSPCPETPCPEIGCPARGIPAPVLRIRSGRSRRRSGGPVLPAPSCSPGQHHFCRDGGLLRPGPGELRGPGFIRTDVGMPVADHRIDMCRTGPPCEATASALVTISGWCKNADIEFPSGKFCTNKRNNLLRIETTSLLGVLLFTPQRHGDARGFFCESWNRKCMSGTGIDIDFVQDNHSVSAQKGTVRGLHFQTPPHAQDKLVRCGRGALLDVAVDIRKGSPTFGKWVAEELSVENGRQLLVPKGFAHGFVSLVDDTEILYKCSDYYAPECDRSLQFDDPEIGVLWGLDRTTAHLSEKDAMAPPLAELDTEFVWQVAT